tara:strand:+ start:3942 stop:4637 length:696 start_codon:yes stop_codon:yes gene_type:complete
MLIDKVYSAVSQLANKDQVSGNLTPVEFNRYIELAQRDYIEENYNPKNKLGYESDFKNTDDLSDLKTPTSLTVLSGRATVPTDYLHFSSAYGTYVFGNRGRVTPIELVREGEWAERLASEVNAPSSTFPIMKSMGSYFEVYPQGTPNINLTYLKMPLQPWWNYTLSGSTPVFSSAAGTVTNPNSGVASGASTDITLGESAYNSLVQKILKYIGIEIREQDLYAMAQQEQND